MHGSFASLGYRDLGDDEEVDGTWSHAPALIAHAAISSQGQEGNQAFGNTLCPTFSQIGGFNGRPDSYRAGSDIGGRCLSYGAPLTVQEHQDVGAAAEAGIPDLERLPPEPPPKR
ncbi:MAG: hypothetical protein ACR2PL_23815 [Dehalococcoidia bacterium]